MSLPGLHYCRVDQGFTISSFPWAEPVPYWSWAESLKMAIWGRFESGGHDNMAPDLGANRLMEKPQTSQFDLLSWKTRFNKHLYPVASICEVTHLQQNKNKFDRNMPSRNWSQNTPIASFVHVELVTIKVSMRRMCTSSLMSKLPKMHIFMLSWQNLSPRVCRFNFIKFNLLL